MNIWILKAGEPLPMPGGSSRLLRSAGLAWALADAGHEVTYWASTFDHQRKRHLYDQSTGLVLRDRVTLQCLHGPAYRKNISLERLRNHRIEAAEFAVLARQRTAPDVIVSCMPTLDLCEAAIAYGHECRAPVIVDVRDMWPEMFTFVLPDALRPFGRVLLSGFFHQLRRALAGAASITAISDPFLNWACTQAGRSRSPMDRVFRTAYSIPTITPDQMSAAKRNWDTRLAHAQEKRLACYVGTVTSRAGSRLLELARLFARDPRLAEDWRLVICGEGDLLDELKKIAPASVLCTGWIDQADISDLLGRADLGIIPYPNTPDFLSACPNKFGEYIASGVPIVTFTRGEIADLVNEHAVGFTCDTADEFATILLTSATDDAGLGVMRSNALSLYRDKFDAEALYAEFARHVISVREQHDSRTVTAA